MNQCIHPGRYIPFEHFSLPTHQLEAKDTDTNQLQDTRINRLRHVTYQTQATPTYQIVPTRPTTNLHPNNVLPSILVMQLHRR
jgi:hypothetical protein